MRSNFYIFIFFNVFESFFEAKYDRRNNFFCFIISSPEALYWWSFFDLVTFTTISPSLFGIFTHNLPCIYFFLRKDEEFASIFAVYLLRKHKQFPDSIAISDPFVRRSISPFHG